jgi:DNA-directed RNA polymerase specialized sigma24 family protein
VVQTRTRTGAEMLYDQYSASLFKIIYCYVKDQPIAEDLLEQTFIHIWNTIDQYKEQPGDYMPGCYQLPGIYQKVR